MEFWVGIFGVVKLVFLGNKLLVRFDLDYLLADVLDQLFRLYKI